MYMGIWKPRAKPEESKFTYAPKTEVYIVNRWLINYDFDLPGGKIARLYQQATRNGAEDMNSVINVISLVCCLVCGGFYTRPCTKQIWIHQRPYHSLNMC